ncbi:MAG: hypothetical protein LBD81_00505 [Holosporaceae bacterium]|jgi:hypothetical protein|nr:hypothetical protein [Holosporaceae bacterium]
MTEDETLLVWFGFSVNPLGVAEPFASFTEAFFESFQRLSNAKCILRIARSFVGSLRYRRVEARSNAAFPSHGRWLQFFGFKYEADMLKYGINGETYQLWSIIKS